METEVAMRTEERSDRTRSADTVRLLRSPLVATLLGEAVTMDLLARNGFRFLGVPGWLDRVELAGRLQRFRSTWRLKSSLARQLAIATVSDGHLEPDSVLRDVLRLENPRHRFVAELFWPHAAEPDFRVISQTQALGSPNVLQFFSTTAKSGLDRILRVHTLALARQCQAIEAELDFSEARSGPPEGKWEATLESWREVWRSDEFWTYLRKRVETLDDPRILEEDVGKARADLPGVILGAHEVLAERYAAKEDYTSCVRHLTLIREARFSDASIRSATANAVRKVTGARLDDLDRRSKPVLAGLNKAASRKTFEATVGPLLADAAGIHRLLTGQLKFPNEFLEQSAFDQFAETIQTTANEKIDYSGDERERNLLYCSIVSKCLLTLPLSGGVRRRIEQSIRNDSRILYSPCGTEVANSLDATKCFFAEGSEADPDASIIIPMHRVTERNLTVDHAQGGAGVQVRWETARVLVPRSPLAKQHAKGGQVTIETPEAEYSAKQIEAVRKLKALERIHRERDQRLAAAGEAEVRAEEQRCQADLKAAVDRTAGALSEAQRAIAKESEAEASQMATEKRTLETRNLEVTRTHEPAVQAARAQTARRKRLTSGPTGIVRIDAPVFAVLFLLLWMTMPNTNTGGAAITAGFVAAVVGAIVRRRVGASADQLVAQAVGPRDAALAKLKKESTATEKKIREAGQKRRQHWQTAIDGIEQEKKRLAESGRRRVADVKQAAADRRKKANQEFEAKVKPLKSEVSRTIHIKRESQKKEFAAYRAAVGKGFKEGARPSQSDMEPTSEERTQALLRLRLGF